MENYRVKIEPRPEDWKPPVMELALVRADRPPVPTRILPLAEELERLNPWVGLKYLPEAEAAALAFRSGVFEPMFRDFSWTRLDTYYCAQELLVDLGEAVEKIVQPYGLWLSCRGGMFGVFKAD